MLKFLRKYQTWLLAVGGVLLMIVFVAPQAVQQFGPNPMKQPAGTLDGERVTVLDMQLAAMELNAMQNFVPDIIARLGIETNDDEHWYLITTAAEQAGLVGGVGDAESLLPEFAAQIAQSTGLTPGTPEYDAAFIAATQQIAATRNSLAGGMRIPGDRTDPGRRFDLALAKALGAQRLLASYFSAPRVSLPRLIRAGRNINDRVNADVMYIPAQVIDIEETISQEDVEAQLAAYRENRPGAAEDGTPFGYLLPNRVRLRWMMVERDQVAQAVQVDPVEVQKRWRRTPEAYGETFDVARSVIEEEIRNEEADRLMREADRIVRSEVLTATRSLEREGDTYVLPDDWSRSGPNYNEIAQKLKAYLDEQTGGDIRPPGVGVEPDWKTLSELTQLPFLGQAIATVGNRRYGIAAILSQLPEFGVETPLFLIQTGVPITEPALMGSSGNRYYVTVTDARTESAPESADEIIATLRTDALNVKRYAALEPQLESLLTEAREAGRMRPIADRFNEAKPEGSVLRAEEAQIVGNIQIRRSFTLGPVEFNAPEIRDEALRLAALIDATEQGDEIPADLAFGAVRIPGQLAISLFKINRVTPMTQEDLQRTASSIQSTAIGDEFTGVLPTRDVGPFTKDALAQRLNWVSADTESDDETDQATDDAEAETSEVAAGA